MALFKVYEAQETPIIRVWVYEVEAETMKDAIRMASERAVPPVFVRDVESDADFGRSGYAASPADAEAAAIDEAIDAIDHPDDDDEEEDD
jgi:hypothetical protein